MVILIVAIIIYNTQYNILIYINVFPKSDITIKYFLI